MEKPWGSKNALAISTRKRELYPGQLQQEGDELLEPSIREDLEELFAMSDDELSDYLATKEELAVQAELAKGLTLQEVEGIKAGMKAEKSGRRQA